MKDNRINGAEELEKELREKMSELSSNVDCFEKISARAFPERDHDFEDSELTVSDVENVTGKHRVAPVLKWVSIAAAVVFCVGVLPKTLFFREFLSNLESDSSKKYRDLISDIYKETNLHDYMVYDMPLSEYAAYDILVSPVFGCPFESEESDDIKVRLFVREINGVPTNQVYAIEYEGEYSEPNFIAAAESKAKFTDKDIEDIGDISTETDDSMAYRAACNAFTGDRYALLVDNDGERVTAASFAYVHFFKYDKMVKALQTQVLYCNYVEESDKYYYDTLTSRYDEESAVCIEDGFTEMKDIWKRSLYYDGTDAMPKDNESSFIRKNFFDNTEEYDNVDTLSWYEPYNLADKALVDDNMQTMRFGLNASSVIFKAPADSRMKQSMCIYEPYITHFMYSSQSDPTINISIDGRDEKIIVHKGNIQGDFADLGKNVEETTTVIEISGDLTVEEREQMQRAAENAMKAHEEAEKTMKAQEEARQQAENTTVESDVYLFSTDAPYIFTFTE